MKLKNEEKKKDDDDDDDDDDDEEEEEEVNDLWDVNNIIIADCHFQPMCQTATTSTTSTSSFHFLSCTISPVRLH